MCFSMPKLSRKVEFVCTVGDLMPGRTYRDPAGYTYMVLDNGTVARLDDGTTQKVDEALRLGYDREGRLYAARGLNKPAEAPPAPDIKVGDRVRVKDYDGNYADMTGIVTAIDTSSPGRPVCHIDFGVTMGNTYAQACEKID